MIGDALPRTVALELSSACPLACSYCERQQWRGTDLQRKVSHMPSDLFFRLADELAAWVPVPHVTLSYEGESTLHPRFVELLAYLASRGLRPWIATSLVHSSEETLAALVEHCSTVCVSLDGPRENFLMRRGDATRYDAVMGSFNRLLELRGVKERRAEIAVSSVVTATDSPLLARFAAEWHGRVDTVYGWLEIEYGRRIACGDASFGSAGPRRRCRNPYEYLAVMSDGRLSPCCVSSRVWLPVQAADGLASAWQSAAYREFRRRHAELRLSGTPCDSCDLWLDGWSADEQWTLEWAGRRWLGVVCGSTIRVTGVEDCAVQVA